MSLVSVIQDHPRYKLNLRPYQLLARRLLKQEDRGRFSVNIILTSDSLLHRLNKEFRKKDKPTDVLSFNFDDPELLGEIYISLDKARLQAREYNATFEEEVTRLLVHGLFHLLGYTHYRKAERLRMESKEAQYR